MDSGQLRMLLVEDDEDDYVLTRELLAEIGIPESNLEWVTTYEAGVAAIARGDHDVCLLDYRLGERTGLDLLRQAIGNGWRVPVILLTGTGGREIDIEAMKAGAADYLIKGQIDASRLDRSIRYAIERKRSEDKLLRAQQELKEAQERAVQSERLAAIGQMVAGLAHESRNALQQIQSSLEMLARRLKDQPEARFIAEIQKAQDRLHNLFEDVRGYTAPIKLDCGRHNLAHLWREAWAQLQPLRNTRDVRLREEIGGLDLTCVVDPLPIERVFRNILENSLGACSDPVTIDVHCFEAELKGQPALQIAFRDNGPGIASDLREKIFEPFYTTKTRGTGLGMAIAKRIVEAHGGQIAAGAGPEQGAEILLVLPKGTR